MPTEANGESACATCRARKVRAKIFKYAIIVQIDVILCAGEENELVLLIDPPCLFKSTPHPLNVVELHTDHCTKVKCDERPNGCLNCERLQLACLQNGTVTPSSSTTINAQSPTSPTSIQPVIGIKRKRTFRSCVPCRDSKVKCSGERPLCSRCQQRRTTCVYDAEQNEPAWVQSIGAKSGHDDAVMIAQSHSQSNEPRIPQGIVARGYGEPREIPGCPPGLSWYVLSCLLLVWNQC